MKSPHSVSLSPLLGRQPILFPVRVTSRVCVTASIFQGETRLLAFSGILLTYYHNTIVAEGVFFIWSHKQQKIDKPTGFLYTLNIGHLVLNIKSFYVFFVIFLLLFTCLFYYSNCFFIVFLILTIILLDFYYIPLYIIDI